MLSILLYILLLLLICLNSYYKEVCLCFLFFIIVITNLKPMKIALIYKSWYINISVFTVLNFFLIPVSSGQVDVIMNHNDFKRTGWNHQETILTTDNVSGGNFGNIFSREVDDQIYAQPLVVSNFRISGGVYNIVIVATVNNSLYAFDADDPEKSSAFWEVNLTHDPDNFRPVKNTDMTGACTHSPRGYTDFSGNIGIVGTPAIDRVTNTIYVVARSKSKTGSDYVQYLHAIDLKTGSEKKGSPVLITASYPGTGVGNIYGTVFFDSQKQNQRAGLLLLNGVVYICWASHCSWGPYHGWIIGYDAFTLQQKYIYNTSPKGWFAGIWMSGQPPSVDDDGNILITTGNGSTGYNGNPNDTINRASSLIKLTPALKVLDFFTPSNYDYLNSADRDYGINGALIIPGTHLSLSGSKDGGLYLVDNNNMGGTRFDSTDVLQRINFGEFGTVNTKHLYGSPVYFKDKYENEYIYGWAQGGLLKQVPFDRTTMRFDTLNSKIGIASLNAGYMPGGILSLSSNGSQPGTGILWASHVAVGNANNTVVPGVLQAFDATDVTRELWNSNWSNKRDSIGMFAKFVPPTIANGKVYMATFSNKLNVYGLNPPAVSSCSSTLPPIWRSADIGYVAISGDVCVKDGVLSITASGNNIQGTADAFHYVFQEVVSSDLELTIKVEPLKNTDHLAKSGIMFRQNLDPGSPFIFLGITPADKVVRSQRNVQNYGIVNLINQSVSSGIPYWLRINNKGNKYTRYYSLDGRDWIKMDSVLLSLGTNPYVGIAYSTSNNSILDTSLINNVSIKINDISASNILNFLGKNKNNKNAYLSWSIIEDAADTDYFEIQKSRGNTDFITIGKVSGKNSLKQKHYNFTDYLPSEGSNYYRLKRVEKSGIITYSSIVQIKFSLKKLILYPNPAVDKIYIRNNHKFSDGKDVFLNLIDYTGKQVHKETFKTYGIDITTFKIPAKILNGVYIIMITNGKGEIHSEKIVISR